METFTLITGSLAFLGIACASTCTIHALLHKKEPQSALAWVACICFLPFLGSLAYALFGVSRADSLAARLIDKAAEAQNAMDRALDRHMHVDEDVKLPHTWAAVDVGCFLTGDAMFSGNKIELLRNGEEAYPAMLKAIREARTMVCMSTYIFKGDETGNTFAEALAEAAGRGVDVRLIVDGLGGMLYSFRHPWKHLTKRGVKVQRFLPPRLIPPMFAINLRTHRKVLACDGKVAFTGGMNIGDHHLVSLPKKGRVQDVQFRCSGPVAERLQEAFLMDWAFVSHEATAPEMIQPERCGHSHCRLIFDALGRERENILELVCGVISAARKQIVILTPYFIPPRELSGALIAAAYRGVRVDLILPAKNNLFYVHHASRRTQAELARKGIRIWYQPPPFAHTKLLLIDDYYTLFGSANLDPRSLFLNFELNVEVADMEFQKEVRAYTQDILDRSRRIFHSDYESLPLTSQLFDSLCWLMSPYI